VVQAGVKELPLLFRSTLHFNGVQFFGPRFFGPMMYAAEVPSGLLRTQARFRCFVTCAGGDFDQHLLLVRGGETKVSTRIVAGDGPVTGIHVIEPNERIAYRARRILLKGAEGLEGLREFRDEVASAICGVAAKGTVPDHFHGAAVAAEIEENVGFV
jgi:hypothetical protein